jgi:chemotaxis protein CheZ
MQMTQARKPFRIETMLRAERPAEAANEADDRRAAERHAQLLGELQQLRTIIRPAAEISTEAVTALRREMGEAKQMKAELDSIQEAIKRTKHEIATLHGSSLDNEKMSRVACELDAIVAGTEAATQQILGAAEVIDDHALNLHAAARTERERVLASEIQDRVIKIFEACNFQDLTGQRITKVVTTLSFVEQRIERMIEIWGGIEQFSHITPDAPPAPSGDRALLNGPGLAGDQDRASQDDIDALFG